MERRGEGLEGKKEGRRKARRKEWCLIGWSPHGRHPFHPFHTARSSPSLPSCIFHRPFSAASCPSFIAPFPSPPPSPSHPPLQVFPPFFPPSPSSCPFPSTSKVSPSRLFSQLSHYIPIPGLPHSLTHNYILSSVFLFSHSTIFSTLLVQCHLA